MPKNLNYKERIKIETMYNNGMKAREISEYLGRNKSTIHRELNKYSKDKRYSSNAAHNTAKQNMARTCQVRIEPSVVCVIDRKIIEDQWSPEQISNWLKKHNLGKVSYTWIYDYIAKDKEEGGELCNHMRRGRYSKGPKEYRGNIADRVGIEERPEFVNNRSRIGDLEVDLIVGPKNRGAILSVIDRVSRVCILEKLPNKTAEAVSEVIIHSLATHKDKIHTITSDNGSEFFLHKEVSQSLRLDYYFAHPYASYERGSIENLNGLVRQYIPKGTDFSLINKEQIKMIEQKLNNRPRKILKYMTPIEYNACKNKKVA
jgi:transposase, IS30 family